MMSQSIMERVTVALDLGSVWNLLNRYGTGGNCTFFLKRGPDSGNIAVERSSGPRIAGRVSGEERMQCRIADAIPKEFLIDTNANQKLCIALKVNRQDASPPGPNGEGLRESLR